MILYSGNGSSTIIIFIHPLCSCIQSLPISPSLCSVVFISQHSSSPLHSTSTLPQEMTFFVQYECLFFSSLVCTSLLLLYLSSTLVPLFYSCISLLLLYLSFTLVSLFYSSLPVDVNMLRFHA